MVDQSAEEQKKANIAAMGEELGTLYSAPWQELAIGYVYWLEYVDLFGTKSSRIEMLNRAAPMFFRMIQDELWGMTLLNLARMTDPAFSKGKPNLSLRALPDLVKDTGLKSTLAELFDNALKATEFARDWRNRLIAHRDLGIALNTATAPLKDASRAQVKEALASLAAVLNALALHFFKSGETHFDRSVRPNGAETLLYLLDEGLRSREERLERMRSGRGVEADFARREI